MNLQRAIERYHELLTDDWGAESQAQMDEQLRRRGLYFGGRPLCTVLRPRFLTSQQYRFLQERIGILLGAFDKAYRRAMADPEFRAQFGLLPWEEELIADDPGFRDPSPVSRLDAFFVSEQGGLRFTEYNAETPAGAAYSDLLAEMFLGMPVMYPFLREYEIRPKPARHNVLHALLGTYREWSGQKGTPHVAILDWRGVPTWSEFEITAEYFRSQGVPCTIADPRECELREGRLYAAGEPIDLIYKRVLISELVEREGMDCPVVRAVRQGAVCMVNPFRCKILHKKRSLAVLSDERNAEWFTEEEQRAIELHIPWTRPVEERRATRGGDHVDLVPWIARNREHLVLKPNDDYGGAGIVLGWETDDAGWEAAIRRALTEPYIVQERIALPSEPFPSLVDGRVEVRDRMLDTAPFVFHGRFMDGCMTRLSSEPLLNVTAGGGSNVPTFVLERR